MSPGLNVTTDSGFPARKALCHCPQSKCGAMSSYEPSTHQPSHSLPSLSDHSRKTSIQRFWNSVFGFAGSSIHAKSSRTLLFPRTSHGTYTIKYFPLSFTLAATSKSRSRFLGVCESPQYFSRTPFGLQYAPAFCPTVKISQSAPLESKSRIKTSISKPSTILSISPL